MEYGHGTAAEDTIAIKEIGFSALSSLHKLRFC